MSERSTYLYSLVKIPAFYAFFQNFLGAKNSRTRITSELIQPKPNMKILDVGCGPGTMRPFLGSVLYTGVDFNANHIIRARQLAVEGDVYLIGDVVTDLNFTKKSFDTIILIGVLHHIDDADATKLLRHLSTLIHAKGKIVTVDGMFRNNQSWIATLLLKRDSGRHVRRREQYLSLVENLNVTVTTQVYDDLLRVPYDHMTMTIKLRN